MTKATAFNDISDFIDSNKGQNSLILIGGDFNSTLSDIKMLADH